MYRFLERLPKVASHHAYFTMPFLNCKLLKMYLRVFLGVQTVGIVTCGVTKMKATCSLMIGQFFDTTIVASSDIFIKL